MKSKSGLITIAAIAVFFFAFKAFSGNSGQQPWTDKQLMQPSDLAAMLSNPSAAKPLVYSIGFEADIKGSVAMGPAKDEENLAKFKATLSALPKDASIVIYCGCCPFEHCPNVRPAFKLLTDMGFTNAKLLNLSTNLKADWIDKGYPVNR